MNNYLIVTTILGIILLGVLGTSAVSSDQSIVTDEPFKVTSDTSRYACVISEADNDLLLNCLEMK
jgi:hypothetical protein